MYAHVLSPPVLSQLEVNSVAPSKENALDSPAGGGGGGGLLSPVEPPKSTGVFEDPTFEASAGIESTLGTDLVADTCLGGVDCPANPPSINS